MTQPPESPSSAPPSSPPPAYQSPPESPSSPGPVYQSPPIPDPVSSGVPPSVAAGVTARRPGLVLGAAVVLFVYAGISVIMAAIQVVDAVMRGSVESLGTTLLASSVMFLLVTVGMVVAALLTLQGRDIGRALALALSGYAAAAALSRTLFTLAVVVPGRWDVRVLGMVGVELLIGAVGGVAFVLLLNSGVADWFAQQRLAKRPVPQG